MRFWRGAPLVGLSAEAARTQQLKMQMIFQDPYASLNPRMRVIDIVGEAPIAHGICMPRQKTEYVGLQLNRVGLDPMLMRRFPHQFSGGQRARIGIAARSAVKPEFLVCDESVGGARRVDPGARWPQPLHGSQGGARSHVSSSSATISGVVEHISDPHRLMYLGRVVESGPAAEVLRDAESIRITRRCSRRSARSSRQSAVRADQGRDSIAARAAAGCHFHPRCPTRWRSA
jgi:peptide/nickel transport system ATP-binding protein